MDRVLNFRLIQFCFVLTLLYLSEHGLEATIGPGNRKSGSRSQTTSSLKSSTLSSSEEPIIEEPTPIQSLGPLDSTVLQRDLIQEEIDPRSIIENHLAYCSVCTADREFPNPTLVYITPWNNRGYDLVKIFTKKFDYIAPVWFRAKRTGFEKYIIEGAHDIDIPWIETLKENNPNIRIVPRLVLEKWAAPHVHALAESEAEKQKLAQTVAEFLIAYDHLFDGYVLDLIVQFRTVPKDVVHHIVRDIAEYVHHIETNSTRRKEIILMVSPAEEVFNQNDYQSLSQYLDGFNVMALDFPSRDAAPVAPIGKFNFDSNFG